MHLHLKRGLMNNFVTGLTPFLCKRASASRFDPTLMCMRYYDRSLILSKPVFRNRLVFRCFFAKNNGHTIQRDCVTVVISVVLSTLLARAFYYCSSLIAACAAARRAMGTRKGLQET